jgi:hypothetical protein
MLAHFAVTGFDKYHITIGNNFGFFVAGGVAPGLLKADPARAMTRGHSGSGKAELPAT